MFEQPYLLIIASSLVIGLAAGFVMHRSDFCVTAFLFGDAFLLRQLILLVVVSMALFELGRLTSLIGQQPFPLLGPPSLGPGHMLQIELTENVLMADLELCSRVFSQLREHGIRIAIDDFGTGYSSLSYLKQLPIDILKIDRSFVRDIPDDPDDCTIAAAIIGLARTLWLDVIAEGIETEAQQNFLAGNACTKLQGYLHAKPMPPTDYAAFAKRMASTP